MARQTLFVLFGVGLILFVILGGFNAQYDSSVRDTGTEEEIVNETFTVSTGTIQELDESNRDVIYNESVEVRNVSDADDPVIEQDGNYTWFTSNGTIRIESGSTLDDGDTAAIDYTLWEPQAEQQYVRDIGLTGIEIGGDMFPLLMLMLVVLAGLAVWRSNK